MRSNRIARGVIQLVGVSLVSSAIVFAQMGAQTAPSSTGMGQNPSATKGVNDPTQAVGMNSGMNGGQSQEQMDKRFVHGALEGGMAEVELGKLALQKSSSDDVKKFAQRMIDDHTKLGDDMKPVAEQLGVKMPSGLSKKDQALEAKLNAMSGPQFDKAYIDAMVKDHKKDLSEFQQEAQSASIPAVKEAAQKGEPVIKSHLEEIEQISKGGSASAAAPAQ